MNPSASRRRTVHLGITGHRRIGHPGEVVAAIEQALDSLERAFDTGHIVLLSALAEGADRLAARAVLQRPEGALVAVLPLPEERYLQDFSQAESRSEFNSLLNRAERSISLGPAASRAEAYLAAGEYILDHCQVLLAVWDELPGKGIGGTADIVRRARQRGLPIIRIPAGTGSSEGDALVFESFSEQGLDR